MSADNAKHKDETWGCQKGKGRPTMERDIYLDMNRKKKKSNRKSSKL